jgi:ribosomal protein S18 acetylase RimI-like enzyme
MPPPNAAFAPTAPPTLVRDQAEIGAFLTRDLALHLYELGDLDPFYWPHCRYFGLRGEDGALQSLALLFTGAELPTLLLLERQRPAAASALLLGLSTVLPPVFYAHLSPGLSLGPGWLVEHESAHQKMTLTDPGALADPQDAVPLGPADLPAVLSLYARAYPENWFIPRMLETGAYRGIWRGARLVAVAGVHVSAPAQGVAALGNITVDPDHRGQGLGAAVTSAVCRGLGARTRIGLNVHADNRVAIALYTQLGFRHEADYHERLMRRLDGGG